MDRLLRLSKLLSLSQRTTSASQGCCEDYVRPYKTKQAGVQGPGAEQALGWGRRAAAGVIAAVVAAAATGVVFTVIGEVIKLPWALEINLVFKKRLEMK